MYIVFSKHVCPNHNYHSLQPATSMTGQSSSVVRLCVAVRRKLQLYYGKDGQFKQHLFDFSTPDVPRQLAWGKQYLWVGFKAEYTVYDVSEVLILAVLRTELESINFELECVTAVCLIEP